MGPEEVKFVCCLPAVALDLCIPIQAFTFIMPVRRNRGVPSVCQDICVASLNECKMKAWARGKARELKNQVRQRIHRFRVLPWQHEAASPEVQHPGHHFCITTRVASQWMLSFDKRCS